MEKMRGKGPKSLMSQLPLLLFHSAMFTDKWGLSCKCIVLQIVPHFSCRCCCFCDWSQKSKLSNLHQSLHLNLHQSLHLNYTGMPHLLTFSTCKQVGAKYLAAKSLKRAFLALDLKGSTQLFTRLDETQTSKKYCTGMCRVQSGYGQIKRLRIFQLCSLLPG